MEPAFDAYHKWLGIPPEEQPPNHYRLLGIPVFEKDPEVVDAASYRQITHLRTYQLGKHAELSQKLLNEVNAARVCLLDTEKKAAYDASLQDELFRRDIATFPQLATRNTNQAARPNTRLPLVGAGSALAVCFLLLFYFLGYDRKSPAPQVAVQKRESQDLPKLQPQSEQKPPIKSSEEKVAANPAVEQSKVAAPQPRPAEIKPVTAPSPVVPPVAAPSPRQQPEKPENAPLPESEKLRSQRPAPPLAVAPFDEKQAKQHQQRWAEYLGKPREVINSIGMKLILVPPGEFEMGSTPEEVAWAIQAATQRNDKWPLDRIPSESPRHRVRISRAFYLGVFEVTQAEYQQVMGSNPSSISAKGKEARKVVGTDTSRHPVEMVSWKDAGQFCRMLSAMPKERDSLWLYRLPTEAEWEYACRAGTTTRWYFGDDEAGLGDTAWFKPNAEMKTHPGGQKKANSWGLHDMHGNVWEWCMDWYGGDFYRQSRPVDPVGPPGGSGRVYRGGGWSGSARYCRSANRLNYGLGVRYSDLGLRVLLVPAE